MCTVSYLPTGPKTWLLTSNRDESPLRPTLPPVKHINAKGIELLYPQDGLAGGTWMATANDGRAVCLLNGAFTLHKRVLPYRRSRGLVALDFFEAETSASFFEHYELDNIEPFTLVVLEKDKVYDFRWDGEQRFLSEPDALQPHLWASATLYTPEYIEKRREWFTKWLTEHKEYHQDDIMEFHRTGGTGDMLNDMVMNRLNLVRTVSITSINKQSEDVTMIYTDILKNVTYKEKLNFI